MLTVLSFELTAERGPTHSDTSYNANDIINVPTNVLGFNHFLVTIIG